MKVDHRVTALFSAFLCGTYIGLVLNHNGIARRFSIRKYIPIPTDVSRQVKRWKREAEENEKDKLKRTPAYLRPEGQQTKL